MTAVAAAFVLPVRAAAQSDPTPAPVRIVDYEQARALETKLSQRVLLLTVYPQPGQYQDAALMPVRTGEALAVMHKGRAVIVTSWFLTEDSARITVVRPDSRTGNAGIRPIGDLSAVGFDNDSVETRILERDPESGLTILEMPPEIERRLPVAPFKVGRPLKVDPARPFWCVTPAGAGLNVLTDTAIVDRPGFPYQGLFLAPGRLPMGTVLFDEQGEPWGIAVREAFSGSGFTMIAAIFPKKVKVGGRKKPDPGKAKPGVWIDVSPEQGDEIENR